MDPTQWDAPFPIIVGALFVIVMTRANGTYWVGRFINRGASRTRAHSLLASRGYQRAVDRIHRWGAPVVTASFLTVGVQTMINVAAGAIRMPLRRYLPAVTLGCIIWAFIYGTVGFIGFRALAVLWDRAPILTGILAVVVVAAFAAFVVWRVREARLGRANHADSAAESLADTAVDDATGSIAPQTH